ncbi:class I SAM-dependent methyltransferase [Nocardia sp. CA-129566]|uniref:class I SAM-dependent methyltransferase n=1 Tax=Nocardia sp. CA-129566 TaxID=3239976 RepID=UPI003D9789EB
MPAFTPHSDSDGSNTKIKSKYQELYDGISKYLNSAPGGNSTHFLNYGYRSLGGPDEARLDVPGGVPGADSMRLVFELVGPVELANRSVIDIGCGRGGPASLMAGKLGAVVTGVDLSPEAIAYCRRTHRAVGMRFETGDAEAVPLDAGSADVITNIESSHTYPSMRSFLSEVRRLVRPGGWFLHTDMLFGGRWREVRSTLETLGFAIESDRDITQNVLASRNAMARHRSGADTRNPILDNILGLPGSDVYNLLESSACEYRIVRSRLGGS